MSAQKSRKTTITVCKECAAVKHQQQLSHLGKLSRKKTVSHFGNGCECMNERFCFISFISIGLYGILIPLTLPFALICSYAMYVCICFWVNTFADHIRNRYQLVISYDVMTIASKCTHIRFGRQFHRFEYINMHFFSKFDCLYSCSMQCSNTQNIVIVIMHHYEILPSLSTSFRPSSFLMVQP